MFSYLNQKYLTFLFSLPTENSISLKSISLVNLAIYLFPCKYSKTKILYSKYKYSVVIKWKYNLRRKSLSKKQEIHGLFLKSSGIGKVGLIILEKMPDSQYLTEFQSTY